MTSDPRLIFLREVDARMWEGMGRRDAIHQTLIYYPRLDFSEYGLYPGRASIEDFSRLVDRLMRELPDAGDFQRLQGR